MLFISGTMSPEMIEIMILLVIGQYPWCFFNWKVAEAQFGNNTFTVNAANADVNGVIKT